MTDETNTVDKKSNKGCYWMIGKVIALFLVVYILQWILQIAFKAPDSDEIAVALRPYQNHYLSFSKYYVTDEGASGEFTSDITGAGRFLSYSIFGGIFWFVLVLILSFIPVLQKNFDVLFWIVTVTIIGVVFYWAFFGPYRKAVFTDTELVLEKTEYIFSKKTAHLPFRSIERFEYDFYEYKEMHSGTLLYSQLFAVVGGQRTLLGENQIPIETSDASATESQKNDAQKAIDALTKLIGR